MHSQLKRIEAFLLASLLFIFLAGFFAPLQVDAQLNGPLTPNTTPQDLPKYNQGVDQSITEYLCTPTGQGTDLYDCIGKLYRFGVTAGSVALVFFLVIAGYLYITSGEAGKGKAKGIILSALTGMGILLGSYALLNFIDPSFVQIRPIQPPIFTALPLPSCEVIGFGAKCITSDGQVYNPGGSTATTASEAAVRDVIAKYAPRLANSAGVHPYCALSAKVRQESSYITNNVSNGPPNRVDPNHPDKKFYGLPFTRGYTATAPKGHGIGLNQVFIYGPPGEWRSKGWPDAGTPARAGSEFGFNRPLTVTDLIDPDISMNAGSYYFASLMRKNNNNLYNAYRDYTGGHEGSALRRMTQFYDECKLANRS